MDNAERWIQTIQDSPYTGYGYYPGPFDLDEDDDEDFADPGIAGVFIGVYCVFCFFVGIVLLIAGLILNLIDFPDKRNGPSKKPSPYQYRYLSARDPERVDWERAWVRYRVGPAEEKNPARSTLFDVGNGVKGRWEYKI